MSHSKHVNYEAYEEKLHRMRAIELTSVFCSKLPETWWIQGEGWGLGDPLP